MKQKLLPLLLALSLLLTGCGWMDGRYSSVTPTWSSGRTPSRR